MKTFNVILEVSIEGKTLEEAEAFAHNNLSVVDHHANIYDVHECKVVEAQ